MGTYSLGEVVQRWEQERLTSDQVLGQLLQLVADLEERVSKLEKENRNGNRQG